MDWIKELVKDPMLAPILAWYPVQKFLIRNGKETQFSDDVNCGSDWWEIQVSYLLLGSRLLRGTQDEIGSEGVYAPLIFYADATKMSHFGGKMFHPVVLCLGNVPSRLRNGIGKGGGVLVGYIPAVSRLLYRNNNYRTIVPLDPCTRI
jgi:Plavaka transposase